jgi:hypothetical protein
MTFKEYWEAHVRKNPRFADEEAKIEIKVGMLKRLLEEAHGKGVEQAIKTRRSVDELLRKAGVGTGPFNL